MAKRPLPIAQEPLLPWTGPAEASTALQGGGVALPRLTREVPGVLSCPVLPAMGWVTCVLALVLRGPVELFVKLWKEPGRQKQKHVRRQTPATPRPAGEGPPTVSSDQDRQGSEGMVQEGSAGQKETGRQSQSIPRGEGGGRLWGLEGLKPQHWKRGLIQRAQEAEGAAGGLEGGLPCPSPSSRDCGTNPSLPPAWLLCADSPTSACAGLHGNWLEKGWDGLVGEGAEQDSPSPRHLLWKMMGLKGWIIQARLGRTPPSPPIWPKGTKDFLCWTSSACLDSPLATSMAAPSTRLPVVGWGGEALAGTLCWGGFQQLRVAQDQPCPPLLFRVLAVASCVAMRKCGSTSQLSPHAQARRLWERKAAPSGFWAPPPPPSHLPACLPAHPAHRQDTLGSAGRLEDTGGDPQASRGGGHRCPLSGVGRETRELPLLPSCQWVQTSAAAERSQLQRGFWPLAPGLPPSAPRHQQEHSEHVRCSRSVQHVVLTAALRGRPAASEAHTQGQGGL